VFFNYTDTTCNLFVFISICVYLKLRWCFVFGREWRTLWPADGVHFAVDLGLEEVVVVREVVDAAVDVEGVEGRKQKKNGYP